MSRYKKDINTIYISERLQERMRTISTSSMTTVVAPMGYGKTTMIMWYLKERRRKGDVIHQINIYSDNVMAFWDEFRKGFRNTSIGKELGGMRFPQESSEIGILSEIIENYMFMLDTDYYIFIDDYHLVDHNDTLNLICGLADISADNFHLLVSSRDQLRLNGRELHLGRKLSHITVDDLRLNMTELTIYAKRCDIDMPEDMLIELEKSTEGWFSAIYLNLKAFVINGALLQDNSDIYQMLDDAFVSSMDAESQKLLCVMSLTDEFSIRQACYMTGITDAESIIKKLTESNAFVVALPRKRKYRIHNMLKECMNHRFEKFPKEDKNLYEIRYAEWLEQSKDYFNAALHYEKVGAWDGLWTVIETDWGRSIGPEQFEIVLRWYRESPGEILFIHPKALAVLMTQFFYAERISDMHKCMKWLAKTLTQSNSLSKIEREEIEGEIFLRKSFLEFNNITKMSQYHRKIKRLRPQKKITWTQGLPSVLLMCHRTAGALDSENDEMKECMPYYSNRAYGHGIGAVELMAGETALMRGDFTEADILYNKAKQVISKENDFGLYLSMKFLAFRLSFYRDGYNELSEISALRRSLIIAGEHALTATLDIMEGWISAHMGDIPNALSWITECEGQTKRTYKMINSIVGMVASQILLTKEQYCQVIAHRDLLLEECNKSNFLLCRIYIHIQTAFALIKIGRKEEAIEEIGLALDLAMADRILLPFAETQREMDDVISLFRDKYPENIDCIFEIKKRYQKHINKESYRDIDVYNGMLTKRENEVLRLIAQRMTNDEIAVKLSLGEGTVKQYIHRMYDKFMISGTSKEKRSKLVTLLSENTNQ